MIKALAMAGALALACASADAACLSRADVEAYVAARSPGASLRILAGDEARLFLAAYNATPPRTGAAGDELLLVTLPGEPDQVRIALFARGCMTQGGRMPAAAVRRLLTAVERGGA